MIYLKKAFIALWETKLKQDPDNVAELLSNINIHGKGNSLHINIQNGTIPEVGINGIQVSDLLEFTKEVFVALNTDYPSVYNEGTIIAINQALDSQKARTRDRIKRGVEGQHKV